MAEEKSTVTIDEEIMDNDAGTGEAAAGRQDTAETAEAEEQKTGAADAESAEGTGSGEDKSVADSADGADGAASEEAADAETETEAADEDPAAAGDTDGDAAEDGSAKGPADSKDKKIDELTDKYKRLFAEFDNYRKRTEVEKSGMFTDGQKAVLLKILPVIDNFERAQANVPEELKGTAYVTGVEKIYESFMALMKDAGVTPIETEGQTFDANLHNAVMHIEDENYGENAIVQELQKGYMFKGKVLRYSMVQVAN